ncbi:unnamed protein product [Clonostachys byssicola]|uniref:Uncharacterized protein n=1 Tax=Clonostachys byssicola TaxID=160290 RepID=A0A9N9UEX8_9HYPO|nr:unnamed protein product [Clonostachys byssicola]
MQMYLCSRDDPISALLLRAESIVWFPRIPRVTENQHLPTVNNVVMGNRHPLPATELDNDLRSIGAWSDGSPTTVERPMPPEEYFFNETPI